MFSNSRCQRLLALVAMSVAALGLSGCGEKADTPITDARPGIIAVFEDRGTVQCDINSGITPGLSALKLTNAGVDVLRSGCGQMTGVTFAAICGGPMGEIVLHEIRSGNRDTAKMLGFAPAEEMVSQTNGTDYAWVNCGTGAVLP